MTATVATPSNQHDHAVASVRMIRTLMGGTAAMRAAGETYLPREPAENSDAYKNRVKRSTLFNALGKTVSDMTGKVFQKPIVLGADVPEMLKTYAENVDLAGRHLNVFAKDVLMDAMQSGVNYILVDMQQAVTRADGLTPTLADEQTAGIRPYLCHLKVEDVIGWKSEVIGGVETLTQVRIKETVTEPDGEFGEKEVDQIRVLLPGAWQTWRRHDDANQDQWFIHEEGTTSLSKITLVPVYVNGTGFMAGAPPLARLADLNVAHWQSQSDQRNILHVARVPILFAAGWSEGDQLEIGSGTMVRNSNPDAKLAYVEHSGQAIGAGREELRDLETQMQTMGLQLLVPKPGGQTATGEIRDDAKENSPLAMMADALADALEAALAFMAEYDSLGADAGGSVTVNKDFGVSAGTADVQQLLGAVNAGQISRQTFWTEMKRRGVLADDFDPEIEADRLASEAPALSL